MKLSVLFLCSLFLLACGSQEEENPPPNLLDRAKFVEVMTDIQLVEAIRKQKMTREDDPTPKIAKMYKSVFEKHGITEEQFTSTFTWYYAHPEEMILVYEDVFEQLSLLEASYTDQ